MYKSILFCWLAVVFFNTAITAQEIIKPAFKNLTYVAYRTESIDGREKVSIKDVFEINESGQLHFRSKYYNGVADTTYQLSNEIIKNLNSIFNGTNTLKSYMFTDKLKSGSHFPGPLEYLSYVDKKGRLDEFIIVEPFLEDKFNKAISNLVIMPSQATVNLRVQDIKNVNLENRILKTQKAASYLPKIEEPPPMM